MLALSALSAAFSAPQTPFDAYLERPEPDFAWRDTGVNITGPLLFGGVARILNVTSTIKTSPSGKRKLAELDE